MRNLYIHIPFCRKKCFYCSFPVHAIGRNSGNEYGDLQNQYMKNLIQEMQVSFRRQKEKTKLETIYIGGGTPSLLSNEHFKVLIDVIEQEYGGPIEASTEFTVECDPGTFDTEKINFLQSIGVNRLSVGLQSFDPKILEQNNRSHTLEQSYQSIEFIRNVPFFKDLSRVSFDILFNTPFDTTDSVEHSLRELTLLRPGHISAYSLQIEPGSYFHDQKKLFREGVSPCPPIEKQEEVFTLVHEFLVKKGYSHYEVSNFALGQQGKQMSHHNKVYWRGDQPFYGFGMGASSLQNGLRVNRPRSLKKYFDFVQQYQQNSYPLECIEDENSEQERLKVRLLGRIRTSWGIDLTEFTEQQSYQMKKILKYRESELRDYIDYKILYTQNRIIVIQPQGYLVCDEIVSILT